MIDARTLTVALRGKWSGGSGTACCPAHDDRHPSLSITDGANGRLLLHCHAGCRYEGIRNALHERGLLMGSAGLVRPDPARAERMKREERAVRERRSRWANTIWNEARPIGGTLAERYVRSRGITCALPATLRYMADCWHPTAKRLPALISYIDRIEESDGPAVHRIYLRADGLGKANVTPTKAMLGPASGGAVHLSNAPDALVVAEGIETALSLMSGILPGPATVWAALSAGGMARLHLPARPGRLTIAPDGDDAGRGAAEALAARAHALGWHISMLTPPDGFDWNDVLTGKAVSS